MCIPTNIDSVNLVISCNKVFFPTILTPALALQRCISDTKILLQLKRRPPALTATIVATETVPLTMPILVGVIHEYRREASCIMEQRERDVEEGTRVSVRGATDRPLVYLLYRIIVNRTEGTGIRG